MQLRMISIALVAAVIALSCAGEPGASNDASEVLENPDLVAYNGEVDAWVDTQPRTEEDEGPTAFFSVRTSLPQTETVQDGQAIAMNRSFDLFVREDGLLLLGDSSELLELLELGDSPDRSPFYLGTTLVFSTETADGTATTYRVDDLELEVAS